MKTADSGIRPSHEKRMKSPDGRIQSKQKQKLIRKCTKCDYTTKSNFRLKRHSGLHEKKAAFQCHLCSYSTCQKHALSVHVKEHHICSKDTAAATNEIAIKDNVAGPSTSNAKEMAAKVKPREFKCDSCTFKCATAEQLKIHAREARHEDESASSTTDESTETDSDPIMTYKAKLDACHGDESTSSATDEFSETDSDPVTVSKPEKTKKVDKQENKENQNRPVIRRVYRCPHCAYWFRNACHFRDHFMTHGNTPCFRCSECDYSTKYRTNVSKHIKEKKLLREHVNAVTVVPKEPEDKYRSYLKTLRVPKSQCSGKVSQNSRSRERSRQMCSSTSSESSEEEISSILAGTTSIFSPSPLRNPDLLQNIADDVRSPSQGKDADVADRPSSVATVPLSSPVSSSPSSPASLAIIQEEEEPKESNKSPEHQSDISEAPTLPLNDSLHTLPAPSEDLQKSTVGQDDRAPLPTTGLTLDEPMNQVEPNDRSTNAGIMDKTMLAINLEALEQSRIQFGELKKAEQECRRQMGEASNDMKSIIAKCRQLQADYEIGQQNDSVETAHTRLAQLETEELKCATKLIQLNSEKSNLGEQWKKLNISRSHTEIALYEVCLKILDKQIQRSQSDSEEVDDEERNLMEQKAQNEKTAASILAETEQLKQRLDDLDQNIRNVEEDRKAAAQLVEACRSEVAALKSSNFQSYHSRLSDLKTDVRAKYRELLAHDDRLSQIRFLVSRDRKRKSFDVLDRLGED